MIDILSVAATVGAVAGVLLNNRRRRECFLVWMCSNLVSGAVHVVTGLVVLAGRDAVFLLLAVEGWRLWGGQPVSRIRKGAEMNAREILQMWLREHGYDGLWNADQECACLTANLAACESDPGNCEPGYKVSCADSHSLAAKYRLSLCDFCREKGWHMQPQKPPTVAAKAGPTARPPIPCGPHSAS